MWLQKTRLRSSIPFYFFARSPEPLSVPFGFFSAPLWRDWFSVVRLGFSVPLILLMGLTIFIASLSGALRAYRCGPADVVVVSADGLIAVPAFRHSPSAPFIPCVRIHRAHLWLAVRSPLLAPPSLLTLILPSGNSVKDWGCAAGGCGGWDRPDQAGG